MIRSIFNKLFNRNDDVALYRYVSQEIANKHIDQGLWAKAFSMSGGDENKARAKYIELRIQYLKDESRRLAEERLADANKHGNDKFLQVMLWVAIITLIFFALKPYLYSSDSAQDSTAAEAKKNQIVAQDNKKKQLISRINKVVQYRSKDLPVYINKHTRIDSITRYDTIIIFKVSALKYETTNIKTDDIVRIDTQSVCSDTDVRSLIDDGTYVKAIYKDKNGATFLHFTIGASECASI